MRNIWSDPLTETQEEIIQDVWQNPGRVAFNASSIIDYCDLAESVTDAQLQTFLDEVVRCERCFSCGVRQDDLSEGGVCMECLIAGES